ncbi:apolipoprotein M [Eublepharis macularius]|uniref:Apolipoprotein M n=1 Tax=Eublepharis macularius TaxID=481883 RepID=A0AA97JAC1_EUBMA|nr:apolipoprotein M [Eublepharis macularius]
MLGANLPAMQSLWSFLLYLCGLLVDVFSLCETPVKLHANELDRDQYFGRWFFIAAASSSPSSLETFTTTDSIMFSMTQSDNPERLQLRAAIRLKTGQCVPRSWIYLLMELSADLTTEARTLHPAENCIAAFKNQASCFDMNEFLLVPRTQSACEFQES